MKTNISVCVVLGIYWVAAVAFSALGDQGGGLLSLIMAMFGVVPTSLGIVIIADQGA